VAIDTAVLTSWDWHPAERTIADLTSLAETLGTIVETAWSEDGEHVAVVGRQDDEYRLGRETGALDTVFEKLRQVRFTPDNRVFGLAKLDDAWTVVFDQEPWEERFDFAWNPVLSADGSTVAVQITRDNQCSVAVNGTPWEESFTALRELAISADGKTVAATVQTTALKEADVPGFFAGTWTIAVNGTPWEARFINTWGVCVHPANGSVAAEVRHLDQTYGIAENAKAWEQRFGCVWEPLFHPAYDRVLAPVRLGGMWTLAENGQPLWKGRYHQLWRVAAPAGNNRFAAVVAHDFGRWTVAVDDAPWPIGFSDLVLTPCFSPSGERVAAVFRDAGTWGIVVDGKPWDHRFAMAWDPLFSPGGREVLARVEVEDGVTLALDGTLWSARFDTLAPPCFDPAGERVLVRGMRRGHCIRQVVDLKTLRG